MGLPEFIRLLLRHKRVLFGVPLIMGISVVLLTMNMPKKYPVHSVIYTGIASGYSLESTQGGQFNYFAINNAFDNLVNLISTKSTLDEVGLRLFALHIIQMEALPRIVSEASLEEIKRITPDEVKALVDPVSVENTYNRLLAFKNKDEENFVYELINLYHPHYSFDALSKIKVKRISTSDLVELSYETDDPAVSYQALKILLDVFRRNYRALKENQTDAVVNYFNNQLAISNSRLAKVEGSLLKFNQDNQIINYYEQSKHVVSEKEKFELERQAVMLDFVAAKSAIDNLESQLGARNQLQLQSSHITALRNKLTEINKQKTLYDLYTPKDSLVSGYYIGLQTEALALRSDLQHALDSLHYFENTRSGIQIAEIAIQWLQNVILHDEAKAKLEMLKQRQQEIDEIIRSYAPLGANMKKIERQIDVQEREYLSLLHHLGLAKLKQQNIEMASTLKVVDPPIFPITPKPTKRKLLVIAAMLMGFVVTGAFYLLAYFFDTTIKDVAGSERITQLKCLGGMPFLNGDKDKYHDQLKQAASHVINNQLLNMWNENGNSPMKLAFVSSFTQEGKSTIIAALMESMLAHGIECYQDDSLVKNSDSDRYLFAEAGVLKARIFPFDILNKADVICYVMRADRAWVEADKTIVSVLNSIDHKPIVSIVNFVNPELMSNVTDQVSKSQSGFRRRMKRILNFRFFETFDTNS
ncbi:hypothetical protein DMA11_07060 [Marinilabiliaceae bacterium JC017]|nr:hypothetical protein DMA11_07060 [Marinilabiliaceae bacterium JC017]